MSYSHSEVAHRWVHGQFGRDGEVNGCNMHGDEYSMYSYRTVIAQALDREKDVWVVIDQSLTPSTGQHINHVNRAIPSYATVIRTHIRNKGHYNNVDFIDRWTKFDRKVRLEIATIAVERVFRQYEYVLRGRSLDTREIDKSQFRNIDKLQRIYGDCSLNDWLKHVTCKKTSFSKGEFVKARRMVRMYLDGRSDSEITDALFGSGTWDAMLKRIGSVIKARETRDRMDALAIHMFFWPKREIWRRSTWRPTCHLTAREIRKMSMREMLEMKFFNLERIERHNDNVRYGNPSDRAYKNACKFLGIDNRRWGDDIDYVRDDELRVIYDGVSRGWDSYYWDDTKVMFRKDVEFKSFCASPDKRKWRERFWLLCSLKDRRLEGHRIHDRLRRAESNGESITLTEEESHIHNEFIIRMGQKERREALQRRRDRIEEERRIQSQLERMSLYREQGIDGMRDMWRKRLGSVPYDILTSPNLCYGGNVLLRFASQSGVIETSKGIRLSFEECHRYWDIIQKWHEGGEFRPVDMHGYEVRSFADDILVAGCHEIAYCEMQRMYEEMLKAEAA